MFANLKHEMKELMANMINVATEDMKKQVLSEVKKKHLCSQESLCNLKSLSEAELLESYNRKQNVPISGIARNAESGSHESVEETTNKVLNIANEIGANITEQDISIAHRLPGRGKPNPSLLFFVIELQKWIS